MRVLVTGATGLVGNALCPVLLAAGHEVIAAVRDPASPKIPSGVIARSVADIGPDTDWTEAIANADAVVHLAARAHILQDRNKDPEAAFMRINADGTRRLAEAAAGATVKRFVYVSTVKVMGERSERPFTETDTPHPEDAYGRSKLAGEEALLEITDETELEPVILRSPLVYGPNTKGNLVSLMKIFSMPLPLPFATVNNQRSLINVNNLVGAVVAALSHKSAAGEVFFVRDGDDVSLPGLLRLVASSLGRPVRLFPVPTALLRLAGTLTGKTAVMKRLLENLQVDDGKIRRQLGWAPRFGIEQGLKEMADWFTSGKQL
ncbi:MAG: NAD-dependent epimerase/dehydratase family protein [Rhodospirillales bacterium]